MSRRHDWPEDTALENGNYTNRCLDCGVLFTGHRGRTSCRECSTPSGRGEMICLMMAILTVAAVAVLTLGVPLSMWLGDLCYPEHLWLWRDVVGLPGLGEECGR